MKSLVTLIILLFTTVTFTQTLEGSWKLIKENDKEVTDKEVIRIYQDNYFSEGAKQSSTNEFLWALGGEYSSVNEDHSYTQDFNTKAPELIGEKKDSKITFKTENIIEISNAGNIQVWERISANQNNLSGNWVITGRERNGEMNSMKPGDRRTIKILGGDRFQWVAFNSATREFYGSGGGTYTAEDGRYIENIDFFSRDNNRVGASLEFNFKVKDGEWHHSGKSSKGDPIYEIWSPYAEAYTI